MKLRSLFFTGAITVLLGLTGCASVSNTNAFSEQVAAASKDLSAVYGSECYATYESPDLAECVFGNPESDFHVYLAGDSHSAHWVPPMVALAEKHGWKLTYSGKRGCALSINQHAEKGEKHYETCDEWNAAVQSKIIAEKPNVLITGNYSRHAVMDGTNILDSGLGQPGEQVLADGMFLAWRQMVDAGIEVVIIRDTPRMEQNVPVCLAENLLTPEKCGSSFEDAVLQQPKPELIAAERLPEAYVLDLNQTICGGESFCPSFKGGMVVYRDQHHLTATFAASLQQELERQLLEIPIFGG